MSQASDTTTIRAVQPGELRALVRSGAELAVLDVREGDRYASGHLSVAVPLPDSEAELRIGALVPRLAAPASLPTTGRARPSAWRGASPRRAAATSPSWPAG